MQGVTRISASESTKKSNPATEKPGSNPTGNLSVKKFNMAHIPLYKQYVPPKKKPSEWLYRAENSSNLREGLFEDIVATVNQEGPIHLQALCSRICEIYGLQKVGGVLEKLSKEFWKILRIESILRGEMISYTHQEIISLNLEDLSQARRRDQSNGSLSKSLHLQQSGC
jgi:hypothetical protein